MRGESIDVVDRLSLRTRPPSLPIMHRHWGSLLFMHWPVLADLLHSLIPEPLVADTYDGLAWVGITPFTMWGVRPAFTPPLPSLSESHELNVRTYVHLNGVPGVWFFSLDANDAVAALGACVAFHLPYFKARRRIMFSAAQLEASAIRVANAQMAASWASSPRRDLCRCSPVANCHHGPLLATRSRVRKHGKGALR